MVNSMVMQSSCLDLVILKVFSKLNDSVSLWLDAWFKSPCGQPQDLCSAVWGDSLLGSVLGCVLWSWGLGHPVLWLLQLLLLLALSFPPCSFTLSPLLWPPLALCQARVVWNNCSSLLLFKINYINIRESELFLKHLQIVLIQQPWCHQVCSRPVSDRWKPHQCLAAFPSVRCRCFRRETTLWGLKAKGWAGEILEQQCLSETSALAMAADCMGE